MFNATTLCYVRTDAGEVKKVAEGQEIPDDAQATELDRLRAAGAIAEVKTPNAKRPSTSKSGN